VIGNDIPNFQKALIAIAVLGIGLLLLQNRGETTIISSWGGTNAQNKSAGIAGEAAQTGRGLPGEPNAPYGNPLRSTRTVLTQGYGVGSHAPAAVWGGFDLALDGDGDGQADPKGTANAPIYATHDGIAQVRPDTWPAGNYLAILGDGYKTAYAHLSSYAIQDGQAVRRGDVVGYVGTTGQSTGPHLHYEIWKDGVNVDPGEYGALEGVIR
jgi:murein DD-endopeptidase MepM/ murein hydrolase activator NlpD